MKNVLSKRQRYESDIAQCTMMRRTVKQRTCFQSILRVNYLEITQEKGRETGRKPGKGLSSNVTEEIYKWLTGYEQSSIYLVSGKCKLNHRWILTLSYWSAWKKHISSCKLTSAGTRENSHLLTQRSSLVSQGRVLCFIHHRWIYAHLWPTILHWGLNATKIHIEVTIKIERINKSE